MAHTSFDVFVQASCSWTIVASTSEARCYAIEAKIMLRNMLFFLLAYFSFAPHDAALTARIRRFTFAR